MTEWAGNKDRQVHLVRRIVRECKIAKEHPIDIAGATGTIMANLICDQAGNYESAVEGLAAHYGDMMQVIRQRFNNPKDN